MREFHLHVHEPCPSLLPGSCGVRWGRQRSPSRPPGLSLLEGPNQRQTVFAKLHVHRRSLEMPHGQRMDLMALVLPSSMQQSQSQRLGLLHPALTIPCPLQVATPFT